MVIGNRHTSPVTKIRTYGLMLDNDVIVDLVNSCHVSDMTRNIISFHALFRQ